MNNFSSLLIKMASENMMLDGLYPDDINLEGIKHLGMGLGTQIVSRTKKIQE